MHYVVSFKVAGKMLRMRVVRGQTQIGVAIVEALKRCYTEDDADAERIDISVQKVGD